MSNTKKSWFKMAVYTPHHFEYQCSPNRIFQMSAIFTKNILQTKYMFLYDLTRKKVP